MIGTQTKAYPMSPRHHGVCITCLTNICTWLTILRVLEARTLDADLALIQGEFVLLGSLKYSGRGQLLKSFISSADNTNIHTNPRQNAKIIWGKL